MSYYIKTVKNYENNYYYSKLKNVDLEHRLKNNLFLLKMRFDFWGDWSLPPFLLIVDLKTSIGSFVNIPLKYIGKTNKNVMTYEAHIELAFIDIKQFHEKTSGKEISLLMNFHINEEVFNDNKLNLYKNEYFNFVNEFVNNHAEKTLWFANFYNIKYLGINYFKKEVLNRATLKPTDYLKYKNSHINYPEFYFNSLYKTKYTRFESIDHIYDANVWGNISAQFDKVDIYIDYEINGIWKQLEYHSSTREKYVPGQNLSFGFKTKYDYFQKTLTLDPTGINGIYFPVKANVKIKLNLEKNGKIYWDEFETIFNESLFNGNHIKLEMVPVNWTLNET